MTSYLFIFQSVNVKTEEGNREGGLLSTSKSMATASPLGASLQTPLRATASYSKRDSTEFTQTAQKKAPTFGIEVSMTVR